MGLAVLIIGLAVFLATHMFVTRRTARAALIARIGEMPYKAGFDRTTLERRADPGAPPIPVGGRRNDVIAMVAGTILRVARGFWFHPYVIAMSVFS
jgi:hypothetical protein